MKTNSELESSIDCRSVRNPLVRNGTSQSERLSKALVPSYVKIDEKDIRDTLAFVRKYASHIAYYDRDNRSRENWSDFFELSTTVMLATISVVPHQTVQGNLENLFRAFQENETEENLTQIVNELYELAKQIQEWHRKLASSISLKG